MATLDHSVAVKVRYTIERAFGVSGVYVFLPQANQLEDLGNLETQYGRVVFSHSLIGEMRAKDACSEFRKTLIPASSTTEEKLPTFAVEHYDITMTMVHPYATLVRLDVLLALYGEDISSGF